MRELLNFLVSKRHWFLFIFLEVICLVLIYRHSTYRQSVLLSSANVVTGYVGSLTGSVSSYMNLGDVNRDLSERNGQLEMELLELKELLKRKEAEEADFTGFVPDSTEHFPFRFIMARVINNSVSHISNYLTINKGAKDGIAPDMGVVSEKGIVGIVTTVSSHFAVVMPILNPKLRLSAKIAGSNYFGSLGWNGRNARYVQLDEIPRHVEFEKGDTVVTSGFSAIFPAGIMVGQVSDFKRQHDDNFYSLEVELSTDFQALDNVRILINMQQAEQMQLEREARRNDK